MKFLYDTSAARRMFDTSRSVVLQSGEIGMHDVTDDLLRISRDLAPLKKGTLRQTSGKRVERHGDKVVGEVFFSATEIGKNGEVINYALITHELGESFKNPTTPGTQPKYLEQPFKENTNRYRGMLNDAVKRGLM